VIGQFYNDKQIAHARGHGVGGITVVAERPFHRGF
jgi:hypothetical protein